MKIAALVSIAAAGRQARDAQSILERKPTHATQYLGEILGLYLMITNQDTGLAAKLLDYGCWCRINNQDRIVHGNPVDAIDAACKEWHQCRACTAIDFNSCDPNGIVDYKALINPNKNRFDCQQNSEQCSVRLRVSLVETSLFLGNEL